MEVETWVIRNQVCEDPGEENFWQREQQIQGPDKEWGEFITVFEEQIAGQWDGM